MAEAFYVRKFERFDKKSWDKVKRKRSGRWFRAPGKWVVLVNGINARPGDRCLVIASRTGKKRVAVLGAPADVRIPTAEERDAMVKSLAQMRSHEASMKHAAIAERLARPMPTPPRLSLGDCPE